MNNLCEGNQSCESIPVLFTVREASRILRITRAKVYMMIQMGLLEGEKVGYDWRIRRSSIEKYTGPLVKKCECGSDLELLVAA